MMWEASRLADGGRRSWCFFGGGNIMTLKVINIQGEVLKELPKNAG